MWILSAVLFWKACVVVFMIMPPNIHFNTSINSCSYIMYTRQPEMQNSPGAFFDFCDFFRCSK